MVVSSLMVLVVGRVLMLWERGRISVLRRVRSGSAAYPWGDVVVLEWVLLGDDVWWCGGVLCGVG